MLNNDQLRAKCPAAFASRPASKVSDKYQFVPTHEVLDLLEKENWLPIHAKQQKTRNPESMEGTKHSILLRNASIAVANEGIGGTYPTLRIINSHDWSSRFQIFFGMLRLACSNGLFFAGANFVAFDVRHDQIKEDLAVILSRFASASTRMQATIEEWAGIELSYQQERELAIAGVRARFGQDFNGDMELAIALLNQARRPEDQGSSLWLAFNRIQENAIVGGLKVGRRRSRHVGNIAAEKSINETLFLAAEGMARLIKG